MSAFGQPFQQRVPGYDLQQHARNAETEILHGGKEAAREDPFEQRADDLVSQYDGDHRQHRNVFQVTGRHSGGYGQRDRFDQDLGQYGGSGHPEQRAVRQRREHGRQQADPDAEFIGCDQRKEVDRQQDQSPLRNQMA